MKSSTKAATNVAKNSDEVVTSKKTKSTIKFEQLEEAVVNNPSAFGFLTKSKDVHTPIDSSSIARRNLARIAEGEKAPILTATKTVVKPTTKPSKSEPSSFPVTTLLPVATTDNDVESDEDDDFTQAEKDEVFQEHLKDEFRILCRKAGGNSTVDKASQITRRMLTKELESLAKGMVLARIDMFQKRISKELFFANKRVENTTGSDKFRDVIRVRTLKEVEAVFNEIFNA